MPAVYPLYSETIKAAIVALNKRNGSSSQAIEEYIKVRSYKVGEVGPHLSQEPAATGKLVHTKVSS